MMSHADINACLWAVFLLGAWVATLYVAHSIGWYTGSAAAYQDARASLPKH
jgi:hypothetical protein